MRFGDILMTAATQGSGTVATSYDPDAQLWFDAVVTAGGTVSNAQKGYVNTLITALKAAGTWAKTVDMALMVAENSVQALVSLKQLRTGTAVNSPTFATSAGYTFNGTTNYIRTGLILDTHALGLISAISVRFGAYQRNNTAQSTGSVMGTSNNSTFQMRLRPRTTTGPGSISGGIQSSTVVSTTTLPDSSLGMTAMQAAGTTTRVMDRNGASLASATQTAYVSAVLPSIEMWVGCINSSGAVFQALAAQVGLWLVTAPLSDAEKLSEYNAIQTYMTSHGANV